MTRSERDIQRWPMTAKIGIRVKLIISDRLVLSKSSHFLVPRRKRVVQISRSRKSLQFESFCFFSDFIFTGIGREPQAKRQFNPKRHRNANDRLEMFQICQKNTRISAKTMVFQTAIVHQTGQVGGRALSLSIL